MYGPEVVLRVPSVCSLWNGVEIAQADNHNLVFINELGLKGKRDCLPYFTIPLLESKCPVVELWHPHIEIK